MAYSTVEEIARFIERLDFEISEPRKSVNSEFYEYDCKIGTGDAMWQKTLWRATEKPLPNAVIVFRYALMTAFGMRDMTLEDYADMFSYDSEEQAKPFYENDKAAYGWMTDLGQALGLAESDFDKITQNLSRSFDEIDARVEDIRIHPQIEGFITLDELQSKLNLGEWGEEIVSEYDVYSNIDDAFQDASESAPTPNMRTLVEWLAVPGNIRYFNQARQQGLFDNLDKGDLEGMISQSQIVACRESLYECREDICKCMALNAMREQGIYAISTDLADLFSNGDMFARATTFIEPANQMLDAVRENLEQALGERFGEVAGKDPSEMAEEVEYGEFSRVNPAAMSREAVLAVFHEDNFDTALNKNWETVLKDKSAPSLDAAAKESRDVSAHLESEEKTDEVPSLDSPADLAEEAREMNSASGELEELSAPFVSAIDWSKVDENIDAISAIFSDGDDR